MNNQDTSKKPNEKTILSAKATGKSKLLDEVREAITHKIEYPTTNKEYPMIKERAFDLQDRLIDYAVRIIKLSEALPETKAGKHVSSQILRSGTSPAPNYGEAQSAESIADFVHKLKIALKELRETEIWLKIIAKAQMIKPDALEPLLQETNELIAILFKSAETAKKRQPR